MLGKAGLQARERRRAARELEAIAEQVVERLEPFFDVEQVGGRHEGETSAAVYALAETIDHGFTSVHTAIEADMDPSQLESLLRDRTTEVLETARLDDLALRLYDFGLTQLCQSLIRITAGLPAYQPTALMHVLARQTELLEMAQAALAAMPEPYEARLRDFTTEYRQRIAEKLKWVQLMGLSASRASRRYSLSIAYVGLRADLGSADAALAGRGVARADELLAAHPRLIVTGAAGSGKTTILQWLTVRAASGDLPATLLELEGSVPFYVRLRRYAGRPLPRPAELIGDLVEPIADQMPDRWAEGLLSAGRALVLVDGLDELPIDEREAAGEWLSDLCVAYPESRYVVASRHAALSGWDPPEGFVVAQLQPMSVVDVDLFVDHWFAAASAVETDGDARAELAGMAADVKRAMRVQEPIRRLATNPLLCAVICALRRDGSEVLPETRAALYETVLVLLLHGRERARKIPVGDLDLTVDQKRLIVEGLAWWMVRNGYADVSREEALDYLRTSSDRLLQDVEPVDVLDHLINRTGVLREPEIGRVDFVHKTFMEYLAASRAAAVDDLGLLANAAHDVAFQEVAVLATALAAPTRRDRLIKNLLKRAAREQAYATVLTVLAARCADVAPDLDPNIRDKVTQRLETVVPPRDMDAAQALAECGDIVVDLLQHDQGASTTVTCACVRSLALIGSPAALEELAAYGADERPEVVLELAECWSAFDRDEYAKKVMADSPLLDEGLAVEKVAGSLEFLRHLRWLRTLALGPKAAEVVMTSGIEFATQVTALAISDPRDLGDLRLFSGMDALERLHLMRPSDLVTLDGVEELHQLQHLSVVQADRLLSLRALGRCDQSLTSLDVDASQLESLDGIAGHRALKRLDVSVERAIELEPLHGLTQLERLWLSVPASQLDLTWVSDLPRCSELGLWGCDSTAPLLGDRPLGVDRVRVVDCRSITRVEHLEFARGAEALELADLKLTSLDGLAEIVGDRLRRLELTNLDIKSLRGLPPSLQELKLRAIDVRDLRSLADLPSLTSVELAHVPISGFRSLTTCAGLRELKLGELPRLQRVDGLRQLKALRTISPGPHLRKVQGLVLDVEIVFDEAEADLHWSRPLLRI
jgi:NACHT domain